MDGASWSVSAKGLEMLAEQVKKLQTLVRASGGPESAESLVVEPGFNGGKPLSLVDYETRYAAMQGHWPWLNLVCLGFNARNQMCCMVESPEPTVGESQSAPLVNLSGQERHRTDWNFEFPS